MKAFGSCSFSRDRNDSIDLCSIVTLRLLNKVMRQQSWNLSNSQMLLENSKAKREVLLSSAREGTHSLGRERTV